MTLRKNLKIKITLIVENYCTSVQQLHQSSGAVASVQLHQSSGAVASVQLHQSSGAVASVQLHQSSKFSCKCSERMGCTNFVYQSVMFYIS